jgi:predicted ATPase/class 3 adenylate cyclase
MPVFVFTDIENSTNLWSSHPIAMREVLTRHDAILTACIEEHNGRVIKHTGDGLFAVFDGGWPLHAALDIQQRIQSETWEALRELRVRVALNAGEAEARGEDYFGPAVNHTARLLNAGWGGQILLTPEVAKACGLPAGARLIDFGLHVLKDLGEPVHIFELTHPALKLIDFPPLRSLSAHPHNLPPQPTAFVGREEELDTLNALLASPDQRLITLIGVGGIGKTRLALQAAVDQVERFSHGVYFVPLTALGSPESIPAAIAESLKLTFSTRQDPWTQIQDYLREKRILLIIDNFEHLIQGADLLVDLLTAAPQIKILATSRERLCLRSECALSVPGLPFPNPSQIDRLEDYSAARLFIQTARRVHPTFRPTEIDRPYIQRICQLVEGMPLGIELAASWVRTLTCQELAAELENSLDFLETALRDMPARHRSLRAVFDYSWKLLSPDDRQALQRLSVFRGGFQRQAALQITGATLLSLAVLVDKSWVRLAGARYEMLETLRQYTGAKLTEDAEAYRATRRLHCQYYAAFLEQRAAALERGGQREALDEIQIEIENIRLAWQWAIEQGEWPAIAQSLHPLYLFCDIRARYRDGEDLFHKAVQAASSSERDLLYARLYARYGWFVYRKNLYQEGRHILQESLARAQRLNSRPDTAFALMQLAIMEMQWRDLSAATRHGLEALAIYKDLGEQHGSALTLWALGMANYFLGQLETSEKYFQESAAILEPINDLRGIAQALNGLGIVAGERDEWEKTCNLRRQCLAIYQQLDDKRGMAIGMANLGSALFMQGNYEEGRALLDSATALYREIGDRRSIGIQQNNLGFLSRETLKDFSLAQRYYQESISTFWAINDLNGLTDSLVDSGIAYLLEGNSLQAEQRYREALTIVVTQQNERSLLRVLCGFARLYVLRQEAARACELLALILAQAGARPDTHAEAEALRSEIEAKLPCDLYSAATQRGRAMSPADAAYALLAEE